VNHQLLIESDAHQSRVAVLEEGRLMEVRIERRREERLVGAVFKGRVTRVLPGIEAAFVDIGLERDAFLYAGDIQDPLQGFEEAELGQEVEEQILNRPINQLIAEGQEVLVQVVKEPLPNKGARVTTFVTLPGRYLVLLPASSDIGISRRIDDPEERQRLEDALSEIRPVNQGLIVRTMAEGAETGRLEANLQRLVGQWVEIEQRSREASAPALLHHDLELPMRAVRDSFDDSFEVLWISGAEIYEEVVSYLRRVAPELVDRVELHVPEGTLFERFGVESELERALSNRVWLPSGGYLVVSPTEALVAIDVNTGRYVGEVDLKETALTTNLEATREIARQLRLRDLGGIVVADFIDMEDPDHQSQVMAALEAELAHDRARIRIGGLSDFGLVQITRKRSRSDLVSQLTRPCPTCGGLGRVKSETTVLLELRRKVLERIAELGGRPLQLRVRPEVSASLKGEQRAILVELEERLGTRIRVEADSRLRAEEYEILGE
jgi:ribonuclease G